MEREQPTVIMYDQFDPTKIVYAPPKRNGNGGYSVALLYDGKEFIIQGPRCRIPFGVSVFEADHGRKNMHIELSLDGYKTIDSNIQKFFSKISELDEKHKSTAAQNSTKWFGKSIDKRVLDEFYKSSIRESKEPDKWAPTLKIKIPCANGNVPTCELFDDKQCGVNLEDMDMKGVDIIPVMTCSRLWFM
tara:strand:+ start:179 stop:745 length:567 start_codon:yes stop_codon:yes gene_type:complete